MANIGEKLRECAQLLGLSDTEVARRVGLSQSRYANYVLNKREPDFATFAKICRVLGTTPNEVLGFGHDGGGQAVDAQLRNHIIETVRALDSNQLQAFHGMIAALAASAARTAPAPVTWADADTAPPVQPSPLPPQVQDLLDTDGRVIRPDVEDQYLKILLRIAFILEYYDVSNGMIINRMPETFEETNPFLQARFHTWLKHEAINWNRTNPIHSDRFGVRTPVIELLSQDGTEHNRKLFELAVTDNSKVQLTGWDDSSNVQSGDWTAVNDNLALATTVRGNHQIKIYLGGTHIQVKNGSNSFIIAGIYSNTEDCDPNGLPIEHYCRLIYYKKQHPLRGQISTWEGYPG